MSKQVSGKKLQNNGSYFCLIDKCMKCTSGRLHCCFVDLQKAFDSVWHEESSGNYRKLEYMETVLKNQKHVHKLNHTN